MLLLVVILIIFLPAIVMVGMMLWAVSVYAIKGAKWLVRRLNARV